MLLIDYEKITHNFGSVHLLHRILRMFAYKIPHPFVNFAVFVPVKVERLRASLPYPFVRLDWTRSQHQLMLQMISHHAQTCSLYDWSVWFQHLLSKIWILTVISSSSDLKECRRILYNSRNEINNSRNVTKNYNVIFLQSHF